MPAAKPQFSFDIADDGGLLDGAHDANAHSCQTTPYTHLQQHSSTQHQQLGHSAAAPAFTFDIDDDVRGDDFGLDGSSAQRDDRIASNQHASTSTSAVCPAPSVIPAASAALPAAKPSSAVCMQCPLPPKRQPSSAAQSQPGFQSGPGGPFNNSLPAVSKAQQHQPKKAPNSFKPPRRMTTAAGAEADDGAADTKAEMGSRMARPSSRQPLLRLKRAGQAAAHAIPHAVPQAVGKAQGISKDDGAQ